MKQIKRDSITKDKKMSGIQYSIFCTFHSPLRRIRTPQPPTKTQEDLYSPPLDVKLNPMQEFVKLN